MSSVNLDDLPAEARSPLPVTAEPRFVLTITLVEERLTVVRPWELLNSTTGEHGYCPRVAVEKVNTEVARIDHSWLDVRAIVAVALGLKVE